MIKYITLIPSRPASAEFFSSLRAAKRYARSLDRGESFDDCPMVIDASIPQRYARLTSTGWDYLDSPDSWKKA
jgi:hypothetical protein